MYILTQDKKLLMDFGRIEISKNLTTNKNEKYALTAWNMACATTNSVPRTVGLYPDEESASKELRNIIEALKNEAAVYEIR